MNYWTHKILTWPKAKENRLTEVKRCQGSKNRNEMTNHKM